MVNDIHTNMWISTSYSFIKSYWKPILLGLTMLFIGTKLNSCNQSNQIVEQQKQYDILVQKLDDINKKYDEQKKQNEQVLNQTLEAINKQHNEAVADLKHQTEKQIDEMMMLPLDELQKRLEKHIK